MSTARGGGGRGEAPRPTPVGTEPVSTARGGGGPVEAPNPTAARANPASTPRGGGGRDDAPNPTASPANPASTARGGGGPGQAPSPTPRGPGEQAAAAAEAAANPRTTTSPPGAASLMRRTVGGLITAVAFLTVVPIRSRAGTDLRAAAAWFPIVGALVGGLAGATRYATAPLFGPTVASVLALAVLVLVTGGLHQDGLADCADGLGVRGDRERRLAVMRDPATGVFGTLALLGWGLLLTAALAQLGDEQALRALVVAAVIGRAAVLLHAAATPPARPDGLGAAFDPPAASLAVAGVASLAIAILVAGPVEGLAAVAAGAVVALVASAWARRAIGGRTGDTLGATVALTEVAVCLTLLAFATA